MPTIRYATGVNAEYFFILFPLFASLRRFAPDLRIEVCDFGLTGPQRQFLAAKGLLLPTPAGLEGAHPWCCKAALGRYLADRPWDVAFWIDSDMMAVAPIATQLEGIAADLLAARRPLAVCADASTTLDDVLRVAPAPRYEEQARRRGLSGNFRYLNSGFFACASPDFLAAWDRECQAMPEDENLFEQNAFNLTAAGADITTLPMWEWNLCASVLDGVRFGAHPDGTPMAIHPHGTARILHATSHRPEDVIRQQVSIAAAGGTFAPTLKLLRHPALLSWQMELLRQGLEADAPALLDLGLGTRDGAAAADADAEARAHFQKGGELFLLRRFDEAAREFQAVLGLKPGHPRSLFNLAMTEVELGRPAGSLPLLRQAIAADPDYRDAYVFLATLSGQCGDAAGARQVLLQAAGRWPDDQELARLTASISGIKNFP